MERFLAHPSERVASLILGAATAGLLLTLFMHSVAAITTVTSAALGREDKGWTYFCVSRRAWRVYAAHLRFLVACASLISAVVVLRQAADRTHWTAIEDFLAVGAPWGLVYLSVRMGFLFAPIACAEDHGPIVRKAWHLSYRSQGTIAALVMLFLTTGFGLEWAGETVMAVPAAAVMPAESLPALVANYRGVLWAALLAMGRVHSVANADGISSGCRV